MLQNSLNLCIFDNKKHFNERLSLIVIINDDGHEAKGLASLIEAAKGLGRILVVAPTDPEAECRTP